MDFWWNNFENWSPHLPELLSNIKWHTFFETQCRINLRNVQMKRSVAQFFYDSWASCRLTNTITILISVSEKFHYTQQQRNDVLTCRPLANACVISEWSIGSLGLYGCCERPWTVLEFAYNSRNSNWRMTFDHYVIIFIGDDVFTEILFPERFSVPEMLLKVTH